MSHPNSFRINWRDGDKASKEKPHIKLVLNAMKSNFNPDLSEQTDTIKSETSNGKSVVNESTTDTKCSKKIEKSTSAIVEVTTDQKSNRKISHITNSNSHSNTSELSVNNKSNVKVLPAKTSVSDVVPDPKTSSKKVSVIPKSNSDSFLEIKLSSKKDASIKDNAGELAGDRKSVQKKDLALNKSVINTCEMGNIVKPEDSKKRSEKRSDLPDTNFYKGIEKSATVQSSSSVIMNSNIKENHSESKPLPSVKQTVCTASSSAVSDNTQSVNPEEARKKRMARKRALRNRSASHSEGAEFQASGPKRSARRWSKEGESVLQNAIARKEKSLSAIGKSDDDKSLKVAIVRSLRENRNSVTGGKRKSQENQSTTADLSPESKSKSPVSLKVTVETVNGISKGDNAEESSGNSNPSPSKPLSLKHETEVSGGYTKTGKRRYKPFRGLRYSFSGTTKKTKVIRRSTPSQRNVSSDYNFKDISSNLTPKSSNASPMKKLINGISSDKNRSNSPVVADACTSKARKNRREDPLAPSPSPGDTPADASHPESTAISFGAGTAGLCLCQSKTNLYVRKDVYEDNDVSLMCQAVDSLEGRLIGCCNAVGGTESARLHRPSPRVPYVVLCEQHMQRLLRHHCCPGCGHYCTQGRFVQCPALHYYHRDCQLLTGGKPQCPHCGLESPPNEVSISLGVQKYPVFLPQQKLVKQTPSARMSLGSHVIPAEQPPTPPVSIAMTVPIATTILDKAEREKLEKLVNGACSVRSEGRNGHMPRYSAKHLYQASKAGDSEKIIAVIRHGINPNHVFRELNTRTALHAAAEKGHVLAVHVLVQAGSQLDPQDGDLMTPIMLASLNGHTRVVQYLVKAGACVTHQGSDGMTALHIAAKAGQLEICQCLLSNGKAPLGFIDVKDDGGWTPLVWSCEFRHADVTSFLLEKRADPLLRDIEENIALHWAAYSGSEEISERLLDYGCDVNCVNVYGDTPLHVAARQNNLQCVMLFLSRGAKPETANGAGQQALDCALAGGDCYNAINTTAELRKMTRSSKERTIKILSNDITRGKEESEIQCLNGVDEEREPHDYVYVTENCFTSNIHVDRTITSLQSCECVDTCIGVGCKCTQLSLQSWYDSEGKLLPEFNFFDPPMLFECNELCSCNVKQCRNRVVQRGLKARFQLFRTVGKGWGVRTLTMIPKGTYVCEYVGEIISDCEADQREDDSYLFDLDNRDGETYCIDACRYGNIARFINHMCTPNLQPVRVFMGHHDLHFPRIAFFANRDIEPQEELGFDYGDKFWIIKYKSFTCTCGSSNCKYSEVTIKQTLAEYNRKQEEESRT